MSSVRPITLDDATAVEHLLADAVDNYRGRRVELPAAMRDLDIRRPIRVPPHVWGLRLAGQGQHFTTFHLNFNDSDLPPERRVLFELVNARDFVAEHFGVRAERYAAAVAVHRSLRVRENNSLMNHPVWRHVAVQGGARLIEDGFVHTAVQLEGAAPNDVNDEHAAYEHVTVDNLAGSAFVFGHAQAKAMSVTDCEWSACGRYGIDATGRGRWGGGADQGGTFTATLTGEPGTSMHGRGSGLLCPLSGISPPLPSGHSRVGYTASPFMLNATTSVEASCPTKSRLVTGFIASVTGA